MEDFLGNRDFWKLWRSTGKRNASGGFEPSITFLEAALLIPKSMLDTFQVLDDFHHRMESKWLKEMAKKKNQER
jgi:hypothetical protein